MVYADTQALGLTNVELTTSWRIPGNFLPDSGLPVSFESFARDVYAYSQLQSNSLLTSDCEDRAKHHQASWRQLLSDFDNDRRGCLVKGQHQCLGQYLWGEWILSPSKSGNSTASHSAICTGDTFLRPLDNLVHLYLQYEQDNGGPPSFPLQWRPALMSLPRFPLTEQLGPAAKLFSSSSSPPDSRAKFILDTPTLDAQFVEHLSAPPRYHNRRGGVADHSLPLCTKSLGSTLLKAFEFGAEGLQRSPSSTVRSAVSL